jgi:hypothetical protein
MGANLIVLAGTLLLQSPQSDTTSFTEQPSHGIAYERLSDILQYNRVQGLSFGFGYRFRLPGAASSAAYATARYGISDERLTGRVTVLHDFRAGRLSLSGYSDVSDVDPISPGRTIGNTVNGLFAGHDNADYDLARGGSVAWETSIRTGLALTLTMRVDHHSAIDRVARSALNDFLGGTGLFPPNPSVREGTFGLGSAGLSKVGRTKWDLTFDILSGTGRSIARIFADARRDFGSGPGITLRLKAGVGTEPALPQTLFRLGGLNTVRGFEYATLRGPAFWAAQVDFALLSGRVRPILFLDAGQAARMIDLFSSTALVGGGAGLSLLKGLIRLDLSHPVSPETGGKLRFDLVIQGVR